MIVISFTELSNQFEWNTANKRASEMSKTYTTYRTVYNSNMHSIAWLTHRRRFAQSLFAYDYCFFFFYLKYIYTYVYREYKMYSVHEC